MFKVYIDKFKVKLYNKHVIKHKIKSTEDRTMTYETVKTVKGIAITRAKGTHGFYYVNIREGKGFREFHTFRTIKAATEFIEKTF